MYCICICGISWVRVDTGLFSSDLSFNFITMLHLCQTTSCCFFYLFIYFWHNPAARLLAATSLADDASSQHSSDQSDTRTEHSDEDVAEKTSKRGSTAKTTKKLATVKTEVHTHSPLLLLNQALMTLLLFSPLLASNQDGEEASKEKDYY